MNRTSTRLWDFPSAAVLVLILLTVGRRLYSTKWAWGLETAVILVFTGVVLGLALGFSKFKQRAVFWLTFGYSIPVVILILGGFLYRGIFWLERLSDLSDRLAYALYLFINKQPVHDTVLFVIFMALVFWNIGLMAGYAMTRHGNFIGAVAPAGVVLLIVQLYDPGKESNSTFLAVYFFLSLLFLGRLTYVQRRYFWKEQRLSLLAESKTDLHVTLVVVALATVLLAWLAPTSVKSFSDAKTAWENFTHPLRDVEKDLGHAVAGLQAGGRAATVQFFGDSLALGNQAVMGEDAYLRIQIPPTGSTSRYYWRVRSYNIFKDDQWSAENISSTLFSPDQAAVSLADPEGFTINFTFTALSVNLVALVTPARPVWVSNPSELFFVQALQGKMDPIQFQANPAIRAGKKYSVRANIYEPTITQLRSAGEAYPNWVTKNYLQLPDSLSPEMIALAEQITAGAENPYDMAEAITQYLRDTITYAGTVEDPPVGRDPVDWFLFDSRSGFCNYFASAEVLLLRVMGIPARMVVGFAQGEFVKPDSYVVRLRDAHAWPEAYFPGAGWVEFEPTANQTPLERPLDENSAPTEEEETESHAAMSRGDEAGQETPVPSEKNGTSSSWGRLANFFLRLTFLYLISVTILWLYSFGTFDMVLKVDRRVWLRPLPVLLKTFLEKRALTPPGWLLHWAYQAELNPIERSFTTVYRSLHWLGEKPSSSQTPAEAAVALSGLLPDVSTEIFALSDEYQHHLYSQKHGYLHLTRRAEQAIRKEALRVVIQRRWMTFRGIFSPGGKKSGRP
jgi:transglutaminase-like putative cysteine protease